MDTVSSSGEERRETNNFRVWGAIERAKTEERKPKSGKRSERSDESEFC